LPTALSPSRTTFSVNGGLALICVVLAALERVTQRQSAFAPKGPAPAGDGQWFLAFYVSAALLRYFVRTG